ncbi:AAA family ATPase [Micromonospora wenchangensis]|uniref:AAA family ATPase n=1 Tax=Micromonospora wenchangensis TaxID=1185415 RepID=UPI0033C43E87
MSESRPPVVAVSGNVGVTVTNTGVMGNVTVHGPLTFETAPALTEPGTISIATPVDDTGHPVRGRDAIVAEMLAALDGNPSAYLLHGVAGVGKTRVAAAVAEQAQRRGVRTWWVNGADVSLMNAGFRQVVRDLGASAADIRAAWSGEASGPDLLWRLLDACEQPWMLVIDNADDPRVLAAAGRRTADGTGWLRKARHRTGMVVVTSRDGHVASWGGWLAVRHLTPLTPDAGADMLLDLAGRAKGNRRAATHLAARLGGLPLAIRSAGLLLAEARPNDPVRDIDGYLTALTNRFEATQPQPASGDPPDPREVVSATFGLSLDMLAARGVGQALPMLCLLSCFGPAPVPRLFLTDSVIAGAAWLTRPGGLGYGMRWLRRTTANFRSRRTDDVFPESQPDDWKTAALIEDGLAGLRRYGLMELEQQPLPTGKTIEVIRLHPVIRDIYRRHPMVLNAPRRFIVLLIQLILPWGRLVGPEMEPITPTLAQHYDAPMALHTELGVKIPSRHAIDADKTARIGAQRLVELGYYAQAVRYFRALRAYQSGPAHESGVLVFLIPIDDYLQALVGAGETQEAEALLREGASGLSTRARIQLIQVLLSAGKLDDAEAELATIEANGPPSMISYLRGSLLLHRGDYPAAEQQLTAAFDELSAMGGEAKNDTIVANVCLYLYEVMRLSEHWRDDTRISTMLSALYARLGPSDRLVLQVRGAIADILCDHPQRGAAALSDLRRILAQQRNVLGDANPLTAETWRNVVARLVQHGLLDEAITANAELIASSTDELTLLRAREDRANLHIEAQDLTAARDELREVADDYRNADDAVSAVRADGQAEYVNACILVNELGAAIRRMDGLIAQLNNLAGADASHTRELRDWRASLEPFVNGWPKPDRNG